MKKKTCLGSGKGVSFVCCLFFNNLHIYINFGVKRLDESVKMSNVDQGCLLWRVCLQLLYYRGVSKSSVPSCLTAINLHNANMCLSVLVHL